MTNVELAQGGKVRVNVNTGFPRVLKQVLSENTDRILKKEPNQAD
jgi:hypothetical protein